DEVLGALESGIDIEKRINEIYKRCRTSEQIQEAFNQLQVDLSDQIQSTYKAAQSKLLEHFDEEVRHKLQIQESQTSQRLNRYGDWLWALAATELGDAADFSLGDYRFSLKTRPAGDDGPPIPLGTYSMLRPQDSARPAPSADEHTFRPGHPLAEALIARALSRELPPVELELDYAARGSRVSLVERLRGKAGWLRVEKLAIDSLDREETLLLVGLTDDGRMLASDTCEKLLSIPARIGSTAALDGQIESQLESALQAQLNRLIADSQERNTKFFYAESEKLDSWAADLRDSLKRELDNLEVEIRDAKKAVRFAPNLEAKIAAKRHVNELEVRRNEKRRNLQDEEDDISRKQDAMLDEVEARLKQKMSRQQVFTIRWRVT
ncbi:MAG TPA: hypothetical protein PLV92_20580, partial [Pirellulaceae bacterium]|nr:hypothetical protein [Pirellulaceae bacterium]